MKNIKKNAFVSIFISCIFITFITITSCGGEEPKKPVDNDQSDEEVLTDTEPTDDIEPVDNEEPDSIIDEELTDSDDPEIDEELVDEDLTDNEPIDEDPDEDQLPTLEEICEDFWPFFGYWESVEPQDSAGMIIEIVFKTNGLNCVMIVRKDLKLTCEGTDIDQCTCMRNTAAYYYYTLVGKEGNSLILHHFLTEESCSEQPDLVYKFKKM